MPQPRVEHTYLVEHYRPGLGVTQLGHCVMNIRSQLRGSEAQGAPARFLGSVIVPADEAFLVVVEAESELHVRDAYLRAGVTIDRISVAVADLTSFLPATPRPEDADIRIFGSAPPEAPSTELF